MKRLLAFVLTLFVVAPVLAVPQAMEAVLPNMTVRLAAEPCKHEKVLTMVSHVFPDKDFFAGTVTWQGKVYASCWAMLDEKHIIVVDEGGDGGAMPISSFKPVGI